jgi:histidinol-phosphate aminotransferase
MSIAAGAAALDAESGADAYYKERIDAICATRDQFKARMRELGFEMPDSKANFVMLRNESISSDKLYKELYERGILVRKIGSPRGSGFLRVSIGTQQEMEAAQEAIKEVVESAGGGK